MAKWSVREKSHLDKSCIFCINFQNQLYLNHWQYANISQKESPLSLNHGLKYFKAPYFLRMGQKRIIQPQTQIHKMYKKYKGKISDRLDIIGLILELKVLTESGDKSLCFLTLSMYVTIESPSTIILAAIFLFLVIT